MDSSDVAELHDDYVAAWRRDGLQAAMSFCPAEIVIRADGSNPHAGAYHRKAEVQ